MSLPIKFEKPPVHITDKGSFSIDSADIFHSRSGQEVIKEMAKMETRPLVNVVMDHDRIDKLRIARRLLSNYLTDCSVDEAAEIRVALKLIAEALNTRNVRE